MAVIALPNISPRTRDGSNAAEWSLGSLTAAFASPLNSFRKTAERPGAAWSVRFRYDSLSSNDLAKMQAFLASCRGQAQRFYVPSYSASLRGSFAASELLANNFFASGTTGWSPGSTSAAPTLYAADGILRVISTDGSASANYYANQSVTGIAYAPYAMRAIFGRGQSTGSMQVRLDSSIAQYLGNSVSSSGLSTVIAVPPTTSLTPYIWLPSTALIAGSYFEASYTSCARCALIDDGPNLLLRSDEFDNAAWTTSAHATITANALAAPDGTSTADALVMDATTNDFKVLQSVTVSSSELDYSLSVAVKAGVCTFPWLNLSDGTNDYSQWFNLNTGAVASGASVGGGMTNARAFITPLGTNWYKCTLVVRKTSSATTLTAQIGASNTDGSQSVVGSVNNAHYMWRGTLSQSSVPSRLRQTTSTATSGTSQTGGALYLRGLLASTSGLLLAGDAAEIVTSVGSQFVRTTAPLNSDASGLGYWQFEPPLRNSPSDGGAVIVQRPLCRMLLDSNSVRWTEHSGGFSDLEFTAVEDTAAAVEDTAA